MLNTPIYFWKNSFYNMHHHILIFLDLCCGTGHLTKKLIDNHFVVTGIDGSAQMIEYARQNAPDAAFIVDDARYFNINEQFQYVISTGDSLNHILKLDELKVFFIISTPYCIAKVHSYLI